MIERKLNEVTNTKNWNISYYAISKESADNEIKRDHYHAYLEFDDQVSFGVTLMDVPLYEPVYSFYTSNNKDDVYATYTEMDLIKKYDNVDTNTLIKITKELNCVRWKYLTVAHPNIKFKKHYGSMWDILNYVTKTRGDMTTSSDLDKKLKELL